MTSQDNNTGFPKRTPAQPRHPADEYIRDAHIRVLVLLVASRIGKEMENCVIRPAAPEDIGQVQQLNLQAFQHELDHGFDRHINPHWPLSEEAQMVFRGLIEQKESLLLVAVCGTEVVGYLVGHLGEARFQHLGGHPALLQGLFVAPWVRRRGIGEQLARRFLAWAKEKQAAEITVAVAPKNEPALALYRKLGFCDQTLILAL